MRRAFLLALLFLSCKDAPAEPTDCGDVPDFIVVISALDAPLPLDTVVFVEYGGTLTEEYRMPDVVNHRVLFCEPSDREGNPVDAGASGQGGAGGNQPEHSLEALRCELWTRGPATVTVETKAYPSRPPLGLEAKRGQCTVESEIVLQHDDGGT